MKYLIAIALSLAALCGTTTAQVYIRGGGDLFIFPPSPNISDIGRHVDSAGIVVTSANSEDSVGVVWDIQPGPLYLVASNMYFTGNCEVQYASANPAADFPMGAWVVLDSNGDHVPETSPGLELRVGVVAEDYALAGNKVIVTPMLPHYAVLPADSFDPAGSAAAAQAFAVQRSNHTGTQAAGTITGLAAVATSGAYNSLSGTPTLGTAAAQNVGAFDSAGAAAAAQAVAVQRSNHTGSQAISTVTSLQSTLDAKAGSASAPLALTTGNLTISAATTSAAGSMSAADKTKLDGLSAPAARSFSTSLSHTLNSAFQIDASRDALVSYSVSITSTLSLAGGQSGTAFLEYADDSGFTTNVEEVDRGINSNTGSLTLGLNTAQVVTASLDGVIPGGKYVRIRTVNNTGTPSFAWASGQEVKL